MKQPSIVYLLILVGVLLLSGCLFGCKTPEKMLRKFDKLAAECNTKRTDSVPRHWAWSRFPVKTGTVHGKPVFIPGKPVVTTKHDTVKVDCDSMRKAGADTRNVRVPCPPSTHTTVHDTIQIPITNTVEDTRAVDLCNERYVAAMDQASKYKQKYEAAAGARKGLMWWIVGLAGLCSVLLFILIGGMMGKISNPVNWIKK